MKLFGRSSSVAAAALAVAATTLCAATAGANTIAYSDALTPGDAQRPVTFGFAHSHTTCASPGTWAGGTNGVVHYKVYAFRNLASADSCVTVSSAQALLPNTGMFSESTVGGFDLDDPSVDWAGDVGGDAASYSFSVPAGGTFFTTFSSGSGPDTGSPPFGYVMSWQGDSIQSLDMVAAKTALDSSNQLRAIAYGAPGGSPTGTLSMDDGAGHSFSGPVRCLRVSGHNASIVMTFTSSTGQPATAKGAVVWLHDGVGGNDPSGQRNVKLSQGQLDRAYASCPDPALPPGGSFRPTVDGSGITITGP